MKILVDMNLSPEWISFFNSTRHDAVHWSDIGPGSASDIELMTWAADNGRVVLTADLDFGAIPAATESKGPSVIQLRDVILTPSAAGEVVLMALQRAEHELIDGALISIDASRFRLRVLPLKSS